MNILLINPNFDTKKQSYLRISGMPLGLLSIATYLNRHGHNASIVDRFFDHVPPEDLYGAYRPDAVGIALIGDVTILDAVELGRFFRKKGVPVAFGGPYASTVPELILQEGCADYVILGEGEQTWLDLVETLSRHGNDEDVKGLAYADEQGNVRFTQERPFMDLSLLGPTDFTLLEHIENYFQTCYRYDKMLYLYQSKGCTGSCTFCFNSYFHRCMRRVRPVDDLLDEIGYLIRDAGLKTVYFSDELWGLYPAEREAFFKGIEARKLKFIWGCQTRFGVLKREDFEEMYAHGCRWVMFGIEAPPGKLARLANKKLPYDKIPGTLDACREIGLITNISFIINYPHETEQDLKDTVQYALQLSPTYYSIHYYYPMRKSALYDYVVREKLFSPPETLLEIAETEQFGKLISTFSEVKDIDYKVIRSCFLLKALLTKTPRGQQGGSFFIEAVKGVLINVRGQKIGSWIKGMWHSFTFFLSTVCDVVFHPGIRKRYGFRFGNGSQQRKTKK